MTRIAAVDLGSNSFHLVVAETQAGGSFETLVAEKEMLRLGSVVAEHGAVPEPAIEAAVATMSRFGALARAAGADEIAAVATSAIREAENGSEVVDRIFTETGIEVRVISGIEEAALIFAAVRASVALDPAPAVCLDLGGGSLEITVGSQGGLQLARSLHLGVGRLTAELRPQDPPTPADLERLRARVLADLAPVAAEVSALGPRMAVGTSGTLNDLVRMAAAVEGDGRPPPRVHQLSVGRAALDAVHRSIVELPAVRRQKLAGLDGRRTELVVAGSVVLQCALDLFGLDRLTAGEWSLREGIILDAIGHHADDTTTDPSSVRAASVGDLMQRCGADGAHADHVAALACSLFDATRDRHGLPPSDRDLLRAAARLHDIGEHVATEDHHKHTAYLIEHGRLRGFAPGDVDALLVLGRYHRRSDPKASFPAWQRTAPERREQLLVLLALLRLADGADLTHTQVVERLSLEVGPERADLTLWVNGDADLDLWGARRKRALFEKVFGVGLRARAVSLHHPAVAGR